jgi:hypothetical protein
VNGNASCVGVWTLKSLSRDRDISSTGFDRDALRFRMIAANEPSAPDPIKFETPARRVIKNQKS